jgi:phospholipid transport system substrate-binding protein
MLKVFFAGVFSVFLLFSFYTNGVRADTATEQAQKFIEVLGQKTLSSLASDAIKTNERRRLFRKLLREYFAVKSIGAWVLGRYWRIAKKSQKAEYITLFEDLVVRTYADRFTKLSGMRLVVKKSAISKNGANVMVYSKFIDGQNKPTNITWRVRIKNSKFKVIDIKVEGMSMGQAQRSEFASVIRNSGNGVEGLLMVLRNKNKL